MSDVGIGLGKGRDRRKYPLRCCSTRDCPRSSSHTAAGLAAERGVVKECARVTCLQNQEQPVLFSPSHWICILDIFGKYAAHSDCRPNCYANGLWLEATYMHDGVGITTGVKSDALRGAIENHILNRVLINA